MSDPFEKAKEVAVYRSVKYDYISIQTVSRNQDETEFVGDDDVRLSEIATIQFVPLKREEVIHNALATLDKAEHAARMTLEQKLRDLRDIRQQFLALPGAPAPQKGDDYEPF